MEFVFNGYFKSQKPKKLWEGLEGSSSKIESKTGKITEIQQQTKNAGIQTLLVKCNEFVAKELGNISTNIKQYFTNCSSFFSAIGCKYAKRTTVLTITKTTKGRVPMLSYIGKCL